MTINEPVSGLTWADAVIRVLEEAKAPLHYRDIGELVAEQGLTNSVGANPAAGANTTLQLLLSDKKVARISRGIYALPDVARKITEEEVKSAEQEASREANRLTVNAYGLYWSRSLVDWEPKKGQAAQLLGSAGAGNVNFADQDGIYLLHSGNEIAYVGQTYTPNTAADGLYNRLRYHHNDKNKSDRWDTLSWFGFRPVNEDRQLLPAKGNATTEEVINLIEGILIEGLMPRLNMRKGEGSKFWEQNLYYQVEDPILIIKRLQGLAQLSQELS